MYIFQKSLISSLQVFPDITCVSYWNIRKRNCKPPLIVFAPAAYILTHSRHHVLYMHDSWGMQRGTLLISTTKTVVWTLLRQKLFYIRTQCVPRGKPSPAPLYKQIFYYFIRKKLQFVQRSIQNTFIQCEHHYVLRKITFSF